MNTTKATCRIATTTMKGPQPSIAYLIAHLLESGQPDAILDIPDTLSPLLNKATLSDHNDWLLWVEPVAKPTQAKCQALFGAAQKIALQETVNNGWQFSECYWFLAGVTIHAIALNDHTRVKVAVMDDKQQSKKELTKRTPYLWQDANKRRLADHKWLENLQKNSQLITGNKLELIECLSDKSTTEFVLMEATK